MTRSPKFKKGNVISRRYAKALFELALQQGLIESVKDQLFLITKTWQEVTRLRLILTDKKIARSRRKLILSEIADKYELSILVRNFLFLLLEKELLELLGSIANEYQVLKNAADQIVVVSAKVADNSLVERAKNQVEEIMDKVLKRKVNCQVEVDPAIIGGLSLRIGDTVIDNSLLGRLQKMQQELA
jgi:F-type H+-transporting ATPase subunit delta